MLSFVLASTASATIIFDVAEVTANPGDTALVTVFASTDASDILTGFNLPTDVGATASGVAATPGNGMPAGLAYNATEMQNIDANFADLVSFNTGLDASLNPTGGGTWIDGIANGSGQNVQLSSTPVALFSYAIDVPVSAPPSVISVDIVSTGPVDQFGASTDAGPALVSSLGGSIQIIGVGFSDFNDSGTWDVGDLNLVLFNWNEDGANLPPAWINSRPSAGTLVGHTELNQVLFSWGASSSLAAVPEPASVILGVMGLLAFGFRRHTCRPKAQSSHPSLPPTNDRPIVFSSRFSGVSWPSP